MSALKSSAANQAACSSGHMQGDAVCSYYIQGTASDMLTNYGHGLHVPAAAAASALPPQCNKSL